MKKITTIILAFLALTACQSEQEKKDEELRERIDKAVNLSGNQYGQFTFILKGPVVDTIITVEGNDQFQASLDPTSNVGTGTMNSQDNNIQVEYGFKGTELGYQSVNGKETFITIDFTLDTLQLQDQSLEKAKLALRRVRPGDFMVGSYTGILNIDGNLHTARIEFENRLKELDPEL